MSGMFGKIAMVFFLVANCGWGGVLDEDSFKCRLSKDFSNVYLTNGNEVVLRVLDGHGGFQVVGLNGIQGSAETVRGGDVLSLNAGDRCTFEITDYGSNFMLSVTNDVKGLIRGGMGKTDGVFLVYHHRIFANPQAGTTGRDRRFVLDLANGSVFDVEKKTHDLINLPFRSIWRNWEEYWCDHLGEGHHNVDERLRIIQFAELERRRAESAPGFLEFCRGLTNNSCRVVLYDFLKSIGGIEFRLAFVRMRDGKVDVLGLADYDREVSRSVKMFGDNGRLAWCCMEHRNLSGKFERYYEFDGKGNVRRFLELDGKGLDLSRDLRWMKSGTMVPQDGRESFLSDVKSAVQQLTGAWEKRCYVVVPRLENLHRMSGKENGKDRSSQHVESDWEKIVRCNQERQKKGLPRMTKIEERVFLRSEWLKTSRIWFERMRRETTGKPETSAQDAMVDLERARLHYLHNLVKYIYPAVVCRPGTFPETLHEVAACREPGSGGSLLPEGENDLKDLWGHEYRYRVGQGEKVKMTSAHPVITSAGPDGVFGTEDDLSSEDWFVFRRIENERRREQPGMSSNR